MANYDLLAAAAKAKRDKSNSKRWTEMDKRATVVNFLNSGNSFETITVAGKKSSYIVTALNQIIKADNVSELCYAVEAEGNAHLVSFVDTEPVEDSDTDEV